MIFASFPLAEAVGVILAHSVRLPDRTFKKGRALSADDVAALRAAGIESVTGARLEPGDVPEDEAATRIARAVAGPLTAPTRAATGRCNLVAESRGLLEVDAAAVDALNLMDEAVTVATAPPWEVVEPGQVVATIKIIPFSVPAAVLEGCEARAAARPPLRVRPLAARDAALILTHLPGMKAGVLDQTVEVTRGRLSALGSRLTVERRCPHEEGPIRSALAEALAAGCDLVLISGASATVDRRDVVPAAIVAAGGEIEHFGMPVDPGNLLLLARVEGVPVIDMPGCGRSAKLNGLDFVLRRLLAGLAVTRADIMAMGVGGLLKDIMSRPLPREEAVRPPVAAAEADGPRVHALVLAAGRSTRMGRNKLLTDLDGKPLVAHVVEAALASRAAGVTVVVGHEAEAVRAALAGRDVRIVDNPDFAEGMAASLRHGVAALPAEADAVLVCLGDMPAVSADHIDRLIDAFAPREGRAICVPVHGGKRGNPVLLGRAFFGAMARLSGDAGARHLIAENRDVVCEVQADEAVLADLDTPEALAAFIERRALPQ